MKKGRWIFLGLSLILGGLCGSLIFFLPPDFQVQVGTIQVSIVYLFFSLLFLFLFCLVSFALQSKTHGLLFGGFVVTYLGFRLNGLVHPFFFILLVAIFLLLELVFFNRKRQLHQREVKG
jgi:hypothetical protein